MSLQEGGNLRDVLLFGGLCIFMVSLVNFISRGLEEFLAARATITPNVKGNFGLVNAAEKEYAGKKVQQICPKYVMIAGLM
jgi:hypothetical protein